MTIWGHPRGHPAAYTWAGVVLPLDLAHLSEWRLQLVCLPDHRSAESDFLLLLTCRWRRAENGGQAVHLEPGCHQVG
jgi:hypothetical protein